MRLSGIKYALDKLVKACPYRYNIKQVSQLDGREWEVHRREVRVFRRARDTRLSTFMDASVVYTSVKLLRAPAVTFPPDEGLSRVRL